MTLCPKTRSLLLTYFTSLYQKTPLHWAAEGGHKDTVEYLVDKGATKDIKDCNGVST